MVPPEPSSVPDNLAELLEHLGHVPTDRIRLRPPC